MLIRSTVPGADHAVTAGIRSHRLSTMLEMPAASEMAKTHDEKSAVVMPIASAACR